MSRSESLACRNNTVYVAGTSPSFPSTGPARPDAPHVTTGEARAWQPNPGGLVEVIVPTTDAVWVGGDFRSIRGVMRATNLVDWLSIQTNVLDSRPLPLPTDPEPRERRFYRLLLGP